MPRYAPQMSQADLRQLLIDKAIANDYVEDYEEIDPNNPDLSNIVQMLLEELLPDVEKDWSKIDFSTENMDVTSEKITPDGVPYLQIRAGGDWESPLICALYFDGKKFRGYVPKDGNTYNHKAKSAFGNNDSDAASATAQFGGSYTKDDTFDIKPEMDKVEADINGRIQAKGSYTYQNTPVVSKAAAVAKRQAEIEKGQDLSGPITADKIYAVISLAAGGAYVEFKLRSSGRKLKKEEAERVVGVPAILEKTDITDTILWYSPMGTYPIATQKILEDAGFTKDPKNDLSQYAGARTVVIGVA